MKKQKIHWLIHTFGGQPVKLCGRRSQNAPTSQRREEITCSVCDDLIRKWNLRPRSAFPKIPTFVTVRNAFRCPVCGIWHQHGKTDGHRVSHCGCFREGGYYIKEQVN